MTVEIPSFRDWLHREPGRLAAIWLILGKGPSFGRLAELDQAGETSDVLRFGLNHVVRETRVDVFHCIDIEVIEHCGDAVLANAGVAVLPWAPHVKRRLVPFSGYREFLPSGLSLAAYLQDYPILRTLAEQGRLLWYNLRTAPRRLRRPEAPSTPARGFSASAAVHLLGEAGVRRIRTLGVDGGGGYAGGFLDLEGKTMLAAGQDSFDSQFASIADAIQRYRLDLTPLDRPAPVSVRIIAADDERLPARVLAHALESRASLSVRCELVEHADQRQPEALKLAANCLVIEDVRRLQGRFDSALEHLRAAGRAWCWQRGAEAPWRSMHAHGARQWCTELIDAVNSGRLDRTEVAAAVTADHARPSLLAQIDRGTRDPLLLPRRLRAHDRESHDPGVWSIVGAWGLSLAATMHWPVYRRYGQLILDKLVKILAEVGR